MVKFITLAGRKQTGKDTSARYIKQIIESESTSTVHIVHFADALKRACFEIFGIPLTKMESEVGKQELTDIRWPGARKWTDPVSNETGTGYKASDDNDEFTLSRPMTVREVLQFVGTELFRTQMDPDIWVKSVFRKHYRDDDIVVIADCRFPNEADFAKEHGLLIHIDRDTGLAADAHASEVALDGYDGYDASVDNNGSFEDLRVQLRHVLYDNSFLDG